MASTGIRSGNAEMFSASTTGRPWRTRRCTRWRRRWHRSRRGRRPAAGRSRWSTRAPGRRSTWYTAASSNGASPTSSGVGLVGHAARARARASGAAPHFAAHPPHDVHSVSRMSAPASRSVTAPSRCWRARMARRRWSGRRRRSRSRRPGRSAAGPGRAHWRRSSVVRPRAVTASVQSAARTPRTLLAAMLTPVPVQQHTTPRSQRPEPTASPTSRPASGHGSPNATTSTSWPRSASRAMIASVSGVCSSVPNATRTSAT